MEARLRAWKVPTLARVANGWSKSEALTGKWNPPPIVKTQATVGLSAQ
jgi:hypothetical protein